MVQFLLNSFVGYLFFEGLIYVAECIKIIADGVIIAVRDPKRN